MRIVLELGTPTAVALARRAVRHRRPLAMEAERLIERALGVADCDCQPAGLRQVAGDAAAEEEVGR